MSQPHKIVLIGFSSFEKVTFESFFRLAARRPPGYLLVSDASQANLAVINSDDGETLRQCIAARPAGQVLLVGKDDGGTGWPLQKRPLNLMKVLSTVESLLNAAISTATPAALAPARPISAPAAPLMQPAAQAAPARSIFGMRAAPAQNSAPLAARPPIQMPVAAPAFATTKAPEFVSMRSRSVDAGPDSVMRRSVRAGSGLAAPNSENPSSGAGDIGAFGNSTLTPAPAKSNMAEVEHILVVDDSDIALKFMRNRLSRFGFNADLVNSGEEALGKMNDKPYKFVFLDVMMEGLDGYQTCRAIKQRKYADGKPPVVVMLTSRGGTIDKIRGTLAGCDAYLTKPLNERDLIAVLAKHDRNVARGFQETNFGSNAASGFARSAG